MIKIRINENNFIEFYINGDLFGYAKQLRIWYIVQNQLVVALHGVPENVPQLFIELYCQE